MNDFLFQNHVRHRLEEMTNAQLDGVSHDIGLLCQDAIAAIEVQTGKPFWKMTAEVIAEQVKGGGDELACFRDTIADLPILARHLIVHFPEADWLMEAAARKQPTRPRRRNRREYNGEAGDRRDAALARWDDLKEKVDRGVADHVERLDELVAYGELNAGAHALSAVACNKAVETHLREQRIDAIAKFLLRFARVTIGAADAEVAAKLD